MSDLMPPNAPKESRDRAAVIARLSDISVPIRDMWNPWACPEPFLPYLAWSMSVDHWNEDWDVKTQRRVIAASWDTHAHKGTVHAVEQSVAALGLNCELEEWFQNEQRKKGTFGVHVKVGPGTASLTPELQRDVDRAVTKSKRGSQHHDIRLDAGFNTALNIASAIGAGSRVSVDGAAAGRSAINATQHRAIGAGIGSTHTASGSAAGRHNLAAGLHVATAASSQAQLALTAELAGRTVLSYQRSGALSGQINQVSITGVIS